MSIYHSLGKALAIVDHAINLTPSAINNALTAPKTYLMGQQAIRAMPAIRSKKWLDQHMEDAMCEIDMAEYDALPDATPLVDQGTMQLAYHQTKAVLDKEARCRPPGRGQAFDWSGVDWSWTDSEIAKDMGVTRQAVYAARKRLASR